MSPTYNYVLLQLTDPVGPDDAANLARELVDEVPDVCRATATRFFDSIPVLGLAFVPTPAAKGPRCR